MLRGTLSGGEQQMVAIGRAVGSAIGVKPDTAPARRPCRRLTLAA